MTGNRGGARRRRDYHDDDGYDGNGGGIGQSPPRPPQNTGNAPTKKPHKLVTIVGDYDVAVYLVVIMLVLVGVIMVFSASYVMASNRHIFNNDAFYFLRANIRWAVFGFVVMNIIPRFNYDWSRWIVFPLYALTIGLLIAVIFLGRDVQGATRWLNIGGFSLQPSEIAKASMIFIIAFFVDRFPDMLKSWGGLFFMSGVVLFPVVLILIPGGFSTALIVSVIGFGMIFMASPHILRFFVIGGLGVAAAAGYLIANAVFQWNFRGARINAWLDPFAYQQGIGFQTVQSLFAVATGGWFGIGIGESRQVSFIPEPQHDMIFAIVIEELGLLGAFMILFLFAILIWRGILIANSAPTSYGSMLAIGIVITIAAQVIINVGVVTNTIPNTGVPMPFISYGGTSLLVMMGLSGVLLCISRFSRMGR